ncbi:plasma membrane-associated cation-binding protein 1 [Quercus suber]|uniref:Plasma membrane-associated cation-binding protein 1 n=1 Tax=Quercus suber TaxID=58331 RepID=A0AAW0LYE0_QUESU
MGYWKSKVLPKIKKVFEKNGTKKSAAAAEACKSFDESKEQITKEFEEKKTELQPKVLEIYETTSVEIKALVKEPKEPGLKKHSVAFPGSKPVSEASSKYGPALIPGPVFFVFEKVSTFIVTEEKVEPTPEATTTATEKEREIVLVEEEKKEEVVEKIEEEEKKEEVVEKIEEEKKEVVVEAEKAEPTPTPTVPEAKVEEAAEPAKP